MKRLIQATLGKFGYQVVRVGSVPKPGDGWRSFFALLRQFGFDPRHLIDVGANRGSWTRAAREFFPDAYYTLVEPQNHLKVHIQDLIEAGVKIHWINAGIADKSGTCPFTVSYRDDSSSFMPTEQQAQRAGLRQTSVEVTTLNDIVASSDSPFPEVVKIDAEGFDLRALSGASDLFGRTEIFLLEVAVCCREYENTIAAVTERMANVGYRLVDFTDFNRSPKHGVLWLCEAAFIRDGSTLFDRATSYE